MKFDAAIINYKSFWVSSQSTPFLDDNEKQQTTDYGQQTIKHDMWCSRLFNAMKCKDPLHFLEKNMICGAIAVATLEARLAL